MSKHDKLLKRFLSKPKDFRYDELKKLLIHFGYIEIEGSGSRVRFINESYTTITLHKPHGNDNIIKNYALDNAKNVLEMEGFI